MNHMLNHVRRYVSVHWRFIALSVLGATALASLLLYRLGSLTDSLSQSEVRLALFSSSWRHLVDNPLNLPYTFVQWVILTLVPHHGNTITRAASPLFGLLALAAFAYVLRRWYGIRSAVYGSIIFGTSSWFLHVSRYASFDVLYLWAIPTLLAVVIAWDRHHTSRWVPYVAVVVLSALVYIPGLQWLIIAVLLLHPHLLTHSWRSRRSRVGRSVLLALPVVLIIPLIMAFIRNPSLIQTWLGLPDVFGAPSSIVRGLLHAISFFVYRGPATPELWLARAPILSFFSSVMVVLGILFYAKHFRAPRTRLMFAACVIGVLLFALGGPVTISILVPLAYLLVAAGFGYLLHEWLRVFPRNPLARNVGFSLLAAVVTLVCFYNVKAYFIAWPHSPPTKAAFHKHL